MITHLAYAIKKGEPVGSGEFRLDHEHIPELTRSLSARALKAMNEPPRRALSCSPFRHRELRGVRRGR